MKMTFTEFSTLYEVLIEEKAKIAGEIAVCKKSDTERKEDLRHRYGALNNAIKLLRIGRNEIDFSK